MAAKAGFVSPPIVVDDEDRAKLPALSAYLRENPDAEYVLSHQTNAVAVLPTGVAEALAQIVDIMAQAGAKRRRVKLNDRGIMRPSSLKEQRQWRQPSTPPTRSD